MKNGYLDTLLASRRESEERIYTSRRGVTLKLKVDALDWDRELFKMENDDNNHLFCEVALIQKLEPESDDDGSIPTGAGLQNGSNGSRNVAFFNRQRCNLNPSTGELSFPHKRPFDTDVAGEDHFCDTVRELTVIFHIYPSKGSSWRVGLLSGPVKAQYDERVRDMRGFWGSLDLLEEDGRFKKEGDYEVELRVDGEDEEQERDRRGTDYELEEWTLRVSIAWESRVREAVRQVWNVRGEGSEGTKIGPDGMSTVVYHFRHGDDMQTGTRRGFACPWCGRNYLDADALTMHFRHTHTAFNFRRRKKSDTPANEYHFDVSLNPTDSETDCLISTPKKINHTLTNPKGLIPANFFYKRGTRKAATRPSPSPPPERELQVQPERKPRPLPRLPVQPPQSAQSAQSESPEGRKTPHLQLSQVAAKASKRERDDASDSEDEMTDHWLRRKKDHLIDIRPDLTAKQKVFYKFWDRFVDAQGNIVIPMHQWSNVAVSFTRFRLPELRRLGLRAELRDHLCEMATGRMIDKMSILQCLDLFDDRGPAGSTVGEADVVKSGGPVGRPVAEAGV
ncbi:hypothetical protein BC938DRAFT_480702 [Jimgerdemannia flammicorona]|uniref:C2H2-type domain-containing protein n=1 Tax=Jimgerdemannia flammicorona TaxID=994334 RepID=A0A433QI16_9FUNG|nr:hypothetical protein BC938DRAFT_480702 [Jimgerdemannia flammicorona]